MLVIADTSPLNYLILLGFPHVLKEIYGRILTPPAVLMELQHQGAAEEVRAWAAAPPSWLERKPVQHLDASLAADLDAGEREAISLAVELRADVLLIDEAAGRREAKPGISSLQARWLLCCKLPCAATVSIQKRSGTFAVTAAGFQEVPRQR